MICICFMMIKVFLPNWSFVWMKALTSSCEYISMLCYLSSPFILGGYEIGTRGLSATQASYVAFSWTCVIYGFFCSDVSFRKILCYALQKFNTSLHWCVPILTSVIIFSISNMKKIFAYHICHFSSMLEKMWIMNLHKACILEDNLQNSSKSSYEISCVLFNGI